MIEEIGPPSKPSAIMCKVCWNYDENKWVATKADQRSERSKYVSQNHNDSSSHHW